MLGAPGEVTGAVGDVSGSHCYLLVVPMSRDVAKACCMFWEFLGEGEGNMCSSRVSLWYFQLSVKPCVIRIA